MASAASWLGRFFTALAVQSAGVAMPARGAINFTGSGFTITDDPTNDRTNIAINTLAVPTGTGFIHVTAGAADPAARAINLASADVTGVLPSGNQAAQTMGGDVTGTTAAAVVAKVNGVTISGVPAANQVIIASGAAAAAWGAITMGMLPSFSGVAVAGEVTGTIGATVVSGPYSTANHQWVTGISPQLSQAAPAATAAGANFTIAPQAGGATSGVPGSFIVNIAAANGGSGEGSFTVQRASSAIGRIAPNPAGVSQICFWLGSAAFTSSNPVFISDGSSFTYVNSPSTTSAIGFLAGDSVFLHYINPTVNTAYWGGTTSGAPLYLSWLGTTPLLTGGTASTSLTVATQKVGASLILQGDNATTGITITTSAQFFGATSVGGGVGVIGVTDRTTAPTSNPAGGGILFSEGGALKWRGSAGTVTTIATA